MDPDELDDPPGVEIRKPGHGCDGGARRQPESELGVVLAGAHELVGVDLDAGCDAGQDLGTDRRRDSGLRVGEQVLDPVDLVERVDHDTTDTRLQCRGQLDLRLVVPVQDQPGRRDAGRHGHVQLPPGRHVEAHALLVGQPGHGQAQECLGGVSHAVAPGLDRLSAAGPEVGLVVDEQWGADLPGQVDEIDAADGQPTRWTDRCGHGQQAGCDGVGRAPPRGDRGIGLIGHSASGADTPRRPRPIDSPIRVPSTSHRRAWARSGSTPSARIGQS